MRHPLKKLKPEPTDLGIKRLCSIGFTETKPSKQFYFEPSQLTKNCTLITSRNGETFQIVRSQLRRHHYELLNDHGKVIANFRAARTLSYIVLPKCDNEQQLLLSWNLDFFCGRDDWALPKNDLNNGYEVYRWSKAHMGMVRVVGRNTELNCLATITRDGFPRMVLKIHNLDDQKLPLVLCTAFISSYKWSLTTLLEKVVLSNPILLNLVYDMMQCFEENNIQKMLCTICEQHKD